MPAEYPSGGGGGVITPSPANNGKWLRTVGGAFVWQAVAYADVSGLGNAAQRNVGTSAGTVAAGDDSRIVGAAQKASNLSDLPNAATARANLGLHGAAVLDVGVVAGTVAAGNDPRFGGGGGATTTPEVYVASASLDATKQTLCDYVCDGSADQVEINQAISDLTAGQSIGSPLAGRVILVGNDFTLAAPVLLHSYVTLQGDSQFSTRLIPTNGFTGAGVVMLANANVERTATYDLRIDFVNGCAATVDGVRIINTGGGPFTTNDAFHRIARIQVLDATGWGVNTNDTREMVGDDVSAIGCLTGGISIGGSDGEWHTIRCGNSGSGSLVGPSGPTTIGTSGTIGVTTTPAFAISGTRTHPGQTAEGLLINMRTATAIFDDLNAGTVAKWRYPGGGAYSAARQTNEYCAALPDYKAAGVDAVTISLMGAMADPAASGPPWLWDSCAFNSDGSIPGSGARAGFWTRLDQCLNALDALGMVAMIQLLYSPAMNRLANATAVNNAADKFVDWILASGWKNVLFSIGNEVDSSGYTFSVDTDNGHGGADTGRIGLLDRMRARLVAGGWVKPMVGVTYSSLAGSSYPSNAVIPHADWVGFSNNSNTTGNITTRLSTIRAMSNYIAKPVPILVVEDNSADLYNVTDRYATAVSNRCSTGLYIEGAAGAYTGGDYLTGFQAVPTPWGLLDGAGGVTGSPEPTKKLWTDWVTAVTGGGAVLPPSSPSVGINIDGSGNIVSGKTWFTDGHGVRVGGSRNRVDVIAQDNKGFGIDIGGDSNLVTCISDSNGVNQSGSGDQDAGVYVNGIANVVTANCFNRLGTYRGAYAGGTAYVTNDIVTSGGVAYMAIASTTGHAPPNATYWKLNPGQDYAIRFAGSSASAKANTVICSAKGHPFPAEEIIGGANVSGVNNQMITSVDKNNSSSLLRTRLNGRLFLGLYPSAPADADIAGSNGAIWMDEGAGAVKIRVRDSANVYHTVTLPMVP